MSEVGIVGINLDDNYCGRCSICSSICPYDAIGVDAETGEVRIDIEKCQFCGICYSACPVNAIDIVYYDSDTLLKKLEKAAAKKGADTLVLMCRGNSPSTCQIDEILEGVCCKSYVPLRVPCVGRVPPEFIFKTLTLGINNIIAIRCEEEFCRFKDGSRINNQRLSIAKRVLEELGYDDVLRVNTYARKAVYDTDKCVGCDKCVFICPYEAIDVQSLATPVINADKCVGCGACALVCPHLAIQLEGFEYEAVARRIQRYGAAARELKAKGVSPLILAFCCQWSEFSALDQPKTRLFDNKVVLMEIPCFKGLDPYHVIEALHYGFDGVLAVVCSDEDCKLEKGYDVAQRNTAVLRRVLKNLNLQDRFELYTASPRNVGDFTRQLRSFIERIGSLSPLSLSARPITVDADDV
ncbi:MAG: hydrogenase iron-sulfur subunit [Candidatus Bathyarchaeota archaeon]|nr:MAG: hydrogenase iron-sulfur subunit [Candidatus Bathyarchaeota archaeon]